MCHPPALASTLSRAGGLLCRAKAGCGENGGSPSPFQPQQGMSPSLPHPDGAGHRGPHVRAWTWAAGAAQPQPHSTGRMGSCCRSPLAARGAGTGSLPGLPDAPQARAGWPRRGRCVSVVLLRSLLSLCSTRACLGHAAIPEDRLSFPSALPATHEPVRTAVRRGLVVLGNRGRGEITPAPPQRGSRGSWGWSRGAKWLQVNGERRKSDQTVTFRLLLFFSITTFVS